MVKSFDLDQIFFLLYWTHTFESKHFYITTSSPTTDLWVKANIYWGQTNRATQAQDYSHRYTMQSMFTSKLLHTSEVTDSHSGDNVICRLPFWPYTLSLIFGLSCHPQHQAQAAAVTPQTDSPTTTAGLLLLWILCRTGLWSQFICGNRCNFREISILILSCNLSI